MESDNVFRNKNWTKNNDCWKVKLFSNHFKRVLHVYLSRVSTDEYFTRHYHANSKPMGCLIQLNEVFEMWIRSLSMHPDIWNKLMSWHHKSYVNVSRLEILFRSGHQTDVGIFQNQPSWTSPLLLLTKSWYQLNQSMCIMWYIRRVVLVAACVVHPEECILDSYPWWDAYIVQKH